MADYISNYTGPEIDGILEDAIELPEITSEDEGKVLTINSSGEPAWRHNEVDVFGNGISCQDDPGNNVIEEGSVLTLVDVSSSLYACWVPPSQGGSIDTRGANDGDFLKYSSNTGVIWSSIYSGIPEYDNGDARKVLTVHGTDDDLVWSYPIDTSDAESGDFLKYDNGYLSWGNPIDTSGAESGDFLRYGSDGLEWDNPLDTTYASDGDFLRYNNNGLEWSSPFELNGVDSGSFLSYNNDGPLWVTPAGSPSAGEVLTILSVAGSGNFNYEWSRILPTYDTSDPSSDAGKVLTVLDNGTLGWVLPN